MLDLNLQNYVEWRVAQVIPVRDDFGYRVYLKYADGSELVMNCGKTFINVIDYSVEKTLNFNYSWAD